MTADDPDPDAAMILAAAAAQRRTLWNAVGFQLIAAPLILYTPITRHSWIFVGTMAAIIVVLFFFNITGLRSSSPRGVALRALLDEPATITRIVGKSNVLFAHTGRNHFTTLRPRDRASFERMLRARCPTALFD